MTIAVPHNRLTHGAREAEAVAAAVASGYWAGGPRVGSLEAALAERARRPAAVAVGSGLGALRLALRGLGVAPGDEVVVPAYSCVALANAVLACGARPVAVDVTPADWNLDPAKVEAALSRASKAIVAVHTFGAPADVAALKAFGLPVVEDCAHGFGHAGMGDRSDVAITSFYATKLMGAGEGGAVLCDAPIAGFVRQWRDYGDQQPDGTRLNDKMSDITAALALSQLQRLDELVARRANIAGRYDAALAPLAGSGGLTLPGSTAARVWYRYPIEVAGRDAASVIAALAAKGIGAAEPVWDWRTAEQGTCAVAARAYRGLVSLPLYPTLSADEQDAVIAAVKMLVLD